MDDRRRSVVRSRGGLTRRVEPDRKGRPANGIQQSRQYRDLSVIGAESVARTGSGQSELLLRGRRCAARHLRGGGMYWSENSLYVYRGWTEKRWNPNIQPLKDLIDLSG